MTKAIIWCGTLIGAVGGGYLGYVFASWWIASLGALAGAFLGSLLGYVVAGLFET
jgi:hypothetical protein